MPGPLSHAATALRRQLRLLRRHLRYGPPGWAGASHAARDEALTTLFRGVNAHLRSLGGDYWIVYGTLLGWHREGRILPHDYDVDFGAPVARYQEVWNSRHRLPPGFQLYDTSHRHGGPKLYFEYRGWEADLYFFYEDAGQLRVHLSSDIPSDHIPFPKAWFFPPTPVTFLGEATTVPAQHVAYLEHLYGYIGPNAVRDPATGYFRPAE